MTSIFQARSPRRSAGRIALALVVLAALMALSGLLSIAGVFAGLVGGFL